MLNNYKQRKQEGFTIIEVLIVLAIAGLILLVVFLAVPALQRNSRNTTAKSQASSILGAVSEFESNANGKLPAASLSSAAGDAKTIFDSAKLQNITSLDIVAASGTTAPTGDKIVIKLSTKCSGTPNAAKLADVSTAGSTRQYAVLFLTETAGGDQFSCQSA